MKKYKNKETGEIIEWDGMLFLSLPPQLKFETKEGLQMMRWPDFIKDYEEVNV